MVMLSKTNGYLKYYTCQQYQFFFFFFFLEVKLYTTVYKLTEVLYYNFSLFAGIFRIAAAFHER
jgi:hypothetical protein